MSVGIDLSSVVDLLGYDQLAVSRNTATFVNGVATPGTPSSLTIQGSVQPLTGRDLMRLPEAQRQRGGLQVISKVPFQIADHTGGLLSDTVTYQGKSFSVVHVEPWTVYGYFRTVLVQTEV